LATDCGGPVKQQPNGFAAHLSTGLADFVCKYEEFVSDTMVDRRTENT